MKHARRVALLIALQGVIVTTVIAGIPYDFTAMAVQGPGRFLVGIGIGASGLTPTAEGSVREAGDVVARSTVAQAYDRLPLVFEANHGQADSAVQFLARARGHTFYLTPAEAVLVLRRPPASAAPGVQAVRPSIPTVVRLRLAGADPQAELGSLVELPGKVNYFIGRDPENWHTGIPTYAMVGYRNIYRGIDLVYYGAGGQLEFDFIVAPGADPNAIALDVEGAERLDIDARGDLVLQMPGGHVRMRMPSIYQVVDGVRRPVAGGYVRKDGQRIGFQVGVYDVAAPLVIDPVLAYSTYLGGSTLDAAEGIAVDGSGAAYVTGITVSSDFPVAGAIFPTNSGDDVFITKLDPAGSSIIYSTYLRGTTGAMCGTCSVGLGIAVDSTGAAYVTGSTQSPDFPVTPGAFKTVYDGGTTEGFVTKLSPSGDSLVYSTFLGGATLEGSAIAVDSTGAAYVTGDVIQGLLIPQFSATAGAFDTTYNGGYDAYVMKLNPEGTTLVYATFLGGSGDDHGRGIAVDASGSAYLTGDTYSTNFPITAGGFDGVLSGARDAFVTKLDATASSLVYSAYLGGSGTEAGFGIAVDSLGAAYVTGWTTSADFPATPGAFDTTYNGGLADAFVVKVNTTGSGLAYATFLGGSDTALNLFDTGLGIAVDSAGQAHVTGRTDSPDFPTAQAIDATFNGGVNAGDVFVAGLSAAGDGLLYATFLGGTQDDEGLGIAIDTSGAVYVAGETTSADFPTTSGAFDTSFNGVGSPGNGDGFIVKIADAAAPGPGPTPGPGPAPVTDTVTITRAEYSTANSVLRVEATSTDAMATLTVYVTSTGQLIGILTQRGDGRYSGRFSWPVNPQTITVRSSLGGSATSTVKAK